MPLNGGQRWSNLLAILWALGAAIHQRNDDIEHAESFAGFAHKACSDGKAVEGNADLASCDLARNANQIVWMKNSWGNVAAMAIIPIPIGWLLAFVLLHAGRAQVVGFRPVVAWRTLSKPKKAFVAFSGAAVGGSDCSAPWSS